MGAVHSVLASEATLLFRSTECALRSYCYLQHFTCYV